MTKEEMLEKYNLLFEHLFRHIERNVDFSCMFEDEDFEKAQELYKEFMEEIFGKRYYDR